MPAKIGLLGRILPVVLFFICAQALRAQSDSLPQAESLLKAAIADYDGARYERAEAQLTQALALCGSERSLCEVLHYYRALTLAQQQRLSEALEALANAISLLPANEKLHYRFLQAEWQHAQQQNAAALQTLNQLLPQAETQKSPFLADAYALQGQLLLQQNQARPALTALNRALALRAEMPSALYYRAFAFYAVGAPDKACADLHTAADLGHAQAAADAKKYCK